MKSRDCGEQERDEVQSTPSIAVEPFPKQESNEVHDVCAVSISEHAELMRCLHSWCQHCRSISPAQTVPKQHSLHS